MRLASFFSGMGGFETAFDRAGFTTTFQCEIDANCRKLLAAKWPDTLRLDDINKINPILQRLKRKEPGVNYENWKPIIERLAEADVWCAGVPCQDWSMAGQRAGLAGARSGLWFAFLRLVALFRPAWVVIENVPGLLSSLDGDCFLTILRGLEELGYGVSWRSLDAQYFGLAQRRERVFLVASLGNIDSAKILFESESLCGDSPPSRETGQRIAPTIEGRAGRSGANNFATSGGLAEVSATLSGEMLARHATGSNPIAGAMIPVISNPVGAHHSRQDLENDTWVLAHGQANSEIVRDGSPSLTLNHEAPIMFDSTQITSKGNYSAPKAGAPCHPLAAKAHPPAIAFQSRIARNGRGQPEQICPTLNGSDAGETSNMRPIVAFRAAGQEGFTPSEQSPPILATDGGGAGVPTIQSAMQVRRLTPTECLRLQGYPDDYFDGLGFSDSVKYRMVGNSIAVPVVEWIARRLARAIRRQLG